MARFCGRPLRVTTGSLHNSCLGTLEQPLARYYGRLNRRPPGRRTTRHMTTCLVRPNCQPGEKGTAMTDIRWLPGPIIDKWEWQLSGACRDEDPTLFFHPEGERGPTREAREGAAKAICRRCPVIRECAAHALALGHPAPHAVGLAGCERVRGTLPDHRAAPADRLRGPLARLPRRAAFALRVEEQRRVLVPAGPGELPLPLVDDRTWKPADVRHGRPLLAGWQFGRTRQVVMWRVVRLPGERR